MTQPMIPAAAGTLLLIPFLDAHHGTLTITAHPIIGWRLSDDPEENAASPIFPAFVPSEIDRHSAIEHPDGPVTNPDEGLTFTDRVEWEAFIERALQHGRDEAADKPPQAEPADLRRERAEDRDEGTTSPDDDTREYGKTAEAGRQRRTAAEIAEDKQYLKDVEATGVTIRAANTRFKKLGSRAAVLADLRGESQPENSASGDGHIEEPDVVNESVNPYADDEDLLG